MPGRSLRQRLRALEARHVARAVAYAPRNLAQFGQTAPAITIGCSRPRARAPDDSPGPGAYEVPSDALRVAVPHQIQARPESSYATISSAIDFMPAPAAPRALARIAERSALRYFEPAESPPPSYLPGPTMGARPLTIGARARQPAPAPAPGPGAYAVGDAHLLRAPVFTIPRAPARELWRPQGVPVGPGQYDVQPRLARPKRWAGRLRGTGHRGNKQING
jgi:hypothetical protein